jgi:predicted dehydrogenase
MYRLAFISTAHIHTRGFFNVIAESDRCTVAVVWDDVADRGERYAAEGGAAFVADLDEAVTHADVDGYVICAENTRHLPLLEAVLPVGKPVFCEKPLATRTADVQRILALVEQYGTSLHLGYFQPFSAAMQGVAQVIAAGTLGQITHARYRNAHHAAYGRWFDSPDLAWFTDPELAGGGAFMDMGTHAIHLLRTLLGPVDKAWAAIGNASAVYPAVDDYGHALLRGRNGALITVEASWVQTGGRAGLEVTGSDATLYLDPDMGYVYASPGSDAVAVTDAPDRPTRIDRLIAVLAGEIDSAEVRADLVCAADAVAIMEACYAANATGSWADVARL